MWPDHGPVRSALAGKTRDKVPGKLEHFRASDILPGMNTTRPLLLAALALLPGATAFAFDVALSAEIRLGRVLPPPPPEVIVVEPVGPSGPPPWAPAHGLRRNRDYYYYPEAAVYFRPSDRAWFYLDGGNWRIGAELPNTIRVDFERSVTLTMESDRPFEFHRHVTSYYPAAYFKKVKIKSRDAKAEPAKVKEHNESRSKPDSRGNSGDKPGKGKGKGHH